MIDDKQNYCNDEDVNKKQNDEFWAENGAFFEIESDENFDQNFSELFGAQNGVMERNDKEQREYLAEWVGSKFDELLASFGNGTEEEADAEFEDESTSSECYDATQIADKKKRKKCKLPLDFAVINNSTKNIKKINKKHAKNADYAQPQKVQKPQNFEGKIVFYAPNQAQKSTPINEIGNAQISQERRPSINQKAPKFYVKKSPKIEQKIQVETPQIIEDEKIQKNTQKIEKNSPKRSFAISEIQAEKTNKNSTQNRVQDDFVTTKIDAPKSMRNDTKTAEKRVFYVVQTPPATDKEKESLRAENENLKKENLELKRANNARKEKGFYYAEILTNKSRKDKQRDAQLAELIEEKRRSEIQRKKEADEREAREEKTRDLIRQRKDIQYGLDYIKRKADWWRNYSEESYQKAMMSLYLNAGNPIRIGGLKIDGYDTYMALSLMAMRYSLEYQHDLDNERNKMLEKERELDRLLQR